MIANITSDTSTATELNLAVGKPLLIALAHYQTRQISSHGMLSFRHDGLIEWLDQDGIEKLTDIRSRFKPLIGTHDIYLSRSGDDRVWREYSLGRCSYLSDGVIIPVEPCNFNLEDYK
jgi:hypothetical protein